MGASESKPSSNTPPHLWKAPAPSGISHDLVEQLRSSPEVNHVLYSPSVTSQATEHLPSELRCSIPPPRQPVPARFQQKCPSKHHPLVTDASRAQLAELQIQRRVAEELKRLQAKESEALRLAHDKIASEETAAAPEGQRSHDSVKQEVEALRAKLAERKQVRALPEGVEKARGEVVRCLRENDRRPLDCWKEVEAFKEEVKRLEKGWVEKIIS